jgi:uncharacterized protein (DUF342 family)
MAKKSVEATGTAEISIDEGGLRATLSFQPGEGDTWSGDRVLAAMKEAGIIEGFRPDDVRAEFGLMVERGKVGPVAIAHGIPPSEPEPETVQWLEIKVPEDLEEQARKVIGDAKAPEIIVETRERIKKDKMVTKKPKLPFLPEKQEKVQYTEELVHRKRVYIDPTVERTGYATGGQKLGTVFPKDPGEAGKSVTGDLIPPRVLADPQFYAGRGVTRQKDDLVADEPGFVRIGSNWVDIVPFDTHDWDVLLSDDNATCYFTFDPGHAHAAPPTGEDIREAATELGYPEERLFSAEQIDEIVQRAVAENRALEREPLTSSRDATFDIFVSEDTLQAVLNVHKATGRGKQLDLRELGAAIKRSGLAKLNFDQIKQDISAFVRSHDTELTGYTLVEGRKPEEGPERGVEFSVRFLDADRTAEIKQKAETEGLPAEASESVEAFPAEAIEDVAFVEYEQRILSLAPPVPGKPGEDVYGKPIEAPPTHEPDIHCFEHVERVDNVVVARRSGLLHRGWNEGAILLRVVPHEDAYLRVTLYKSRMAASITMRPSVGTGSPLTYEMVEAAIKENAITSGVRESLLRAAFARVENGERIEGLIFARGKYPRAPEATGLELLLDLATGKSVTVKNDGSADYRNQDRITTVEAGTRIARLHESSGESEEGWDVCGNKLEAPAASSADIEEGDNVHLEADEEGSRVLVADLAGELLVEGNRYDVRPGHTVDGDVDLHSGNVKFPGTVTVKGSVRSGFYVMATGAIHVGELVESALLSADGDIIVNQGVKGGGKGVLRTKSEIGLTFAEQATLLAVGTIQCRGSLMHCEVKANGKLRMIGDKGRIMGGRLRCREGIETYDLGSERGMKTIVEFGQDYLIADRIEKEEQEMEKLKKEITRIDLATKAAERKGEQEELGQLHAKKLGYLKLLEKRGLKTFTLRERFEEHHDSSLTVKGTLWPGVEIQTHGRTLEITAPKKNVIIWFDPKSGRIEEQSADKAKEEATQTS